ncbi:MULTISPECIES: hypothetical protein [Stenotrophomonas]|uniref:hypothetical protein n=1 Tax=Stenotrophomonas TaxID=40323 RepID=UPI0032086D2B
MAQLLNDTIEAQLWAQDAITRLKGGNYGELVAGVVWTDARAEDGSLLVEAEPETMLRVLAREPLPILHGHDPGRPVGNVLEAALFQAPTGERFVAAILGHYTRDRILTFAELGLNDVAASQLSNLPEPTEEAWIQIASDPRDVSEAWVDEIAQDAPLPIVRTPLSHNSSDAWHELIRIGLPFALLVWNPAAKAFGTEVGKAVYAATYTWLKKAIESARERKAPLLCFESHQQGCQVTFLIRGNDVSLNYAAQEGLSQAAAQAARLVTLLAQRGMPASKLVYEIDAKALRWFPSYAVLDNGRIIASTPMLIASASELPAGLSLGLTRKDMGKSHQDKD